MKLRFNIHTLLVFLLLQLTAPLLMAQSFTRMHYGVGATVAFHDVDILNNGSYVCVGGVLGLTPSRLFTVIYSPTGQVQKAWQSNMFPSTAHSVLPTSDGGYIVAGLGKTTQNSSRFLVVKFDAQGDSIWGKNYVLTPGSNLHWATGIVASGDGGYVISGNNITSTNNWASALKIDANGDSVWFYSISQQFASSANGIIKANDGGYLMPIVLDNGYKPGIVKLDANGVEQWKTGFSSSIYSGYTNTQELVETSNGEIILVATETDNATPASWSASFYRLSAQGDSLDKKSYTGAHNSFRAVNGIDLDKDGGYYVTGTIQKDSANHIWLLKLDDQLDTIWTREFGDTSYPNFFGQGQAIKATDDGGCLIAGRMSLSEPMLMRINREGNNPYYILKGKVITDFNDNCNTDVGETALGNCNVQVVTTNSIYYGNTNANGEYSIAVYDTGNVEISTFRPNNYWQPSACQPNVVNVSLPTNGTTSPIINDFYYKPRVNCEVLSVDISTPLLRRCMPIGYRLNYCNHGTLPIDSAYIVLTLDSLLTIDSSSHAWQIPQVAPYYQFDLGNLAVGECGSILLWVKADCDAKLRQALCITANGYPANVCDIPDSTWDGSSVKLYGSCSDDTVKFEIKNEGVNGMSQPLRYIIVEDNVMYKQGQFQLQPTESIYESILGNGFTYTIIAPQSQGHPGHSFPLKSVEGCGTNGQGTFSLGFTLQYPQDDQNEFIDVLCMPVVGSYDPNDKRPEPQGIGAEGYISATQPLDYTIRFQNTGTDTAFLVVIRDTLSSYVDITTLRLTGASHPYTFQIIGSNVLEWTFPNILLPDSNVNEPLSHGFVAFHINQTDGNLPGTEITNRAGIYFDFNAPIITNTTLNTVVEDYKTLFTFVQSPESTIQLGIYPNPNSGAFSLDFLAKAGAAYEFVIYDLAGAKQFGHTLTGNAPFTLNPELHSGMYLYQLLENGQPVGMGKVVVND